MDRYASWAIKQYTRIWGEMAPTDLVKKRLEICQACSFSGEVKIPLPRLVDSWPEFTTMPGCTICGCPFATKPKVVRYFSLVKMRVTRATCPHKDGNKWEEVDQQFLT